MNRFKWRPVFFACVLAFACTIALEAAWLAREVIIARRALRSLQQKRQEREAMVRLVPAPCESTGHAIEAELAAARRTLSELREELALAGEPATATPLDEYLAISRFVDEARTRALERHVGLKPGERFGFASYLNEGPEAAVVTTVQRQRFVLQELLRALLAAGPRELQAVKRERSGATVSVQAENAGAAGDYFVPAVRSRSDAPGLTCAHGFQVEFSGRTPVLRDFMVALAGSPLPLSVRGVEVEPIAPREPSGQGADGAFLVAGYSKFSVTVDFVELLPAGGTAL